MIGGFARKVRPPMLRSITVTVGEAGENEYEAEATLPFRLILYEKTVTRVAGLVVV
jgi:hypothetical protein